MADILELTFRDASGYGVTFPVGFTVEPYDHQDEFWSITHIPTGGPDGDGCHRITHFSGASDYDAGLFWSSSDLAPPGGWQEGVEYFIRAKIKHVTDFSTSASAWGYKWCIWNIGSGGDNRGMILANTPHPTNPGAPAVSIGDADHYLGYSIGRNITTEHTGEDNPNVATTDVGDQWWYLQFSFILGASGTARAKFWQNNNTYAAPTAEHTSFPSGWPMVLSMGEGMSMGGYVGPSEAPDENKSYDIQDFEIATTFDASWYPGEDPGPGASSTLRRGCPGGL